MRIRSYTIHTCNSYRAVYMYMINQYNSYRTNSSSYFLLRDDVVILLQCRLGESLLHLLLNLADSYCRSADLNISWFLIVHLCRVHSLYLSIYTTTSKMINWVYVRWSLRKGNRVYVSKCVDSRIFLSFNSLRYEFKTTRKIDESFLGNSLEKDEKDTLHIMLHYSHRHIVCNVYMCMAKL